MVDAEHQLGAGYALPHAEQHFRRADCVGDREAVGQRTSEDCRQVYQGPAWRGIIEHAGKLRITAQLPGQDAGMRTTSKGQATIPAETREKTGKHP